MKNGGVLGFERRVPEGRLYSTGRKRGLDQMRKGGSGGGSLTPDALSPSVQQNNTIGAEGAKALASAIAQGHTPKLDILWLDAGELAEFRWLEDDFVLCVCREVRKERSGKEDSLKTSK
eukprot:343104-Rhodomonas_salina.1